MKSPVSSTAANLWKARRMALPVLLRVRRFLPLFIAQFLGAFNDNVLKNAIAMIITFKAVDADPEQAQILVTVAAGLFILPYFLFSATAGQLADKYDRAKMARITKFAEIIFMALAAIGFYVNNINFLLLVLFCMGVQATFFGPVKYALLPQHLQEDELLAGNAYIEAGTFLAILLGTITGGILALRGEGHLLVGVILVVAVLGYLSSRFIPTAPAPMPQLNVGWNIAKETWNIIQNDRSNARVWRCILGISWFWLVGATFLSQFPTYVKIVLSADETVVTLFLSIFSVGIGIGSYICNKLLKGQVSSVHVPWACFGLSLFTIDLFFASIAIPAAPALLSFQEFLHRPAHWRIMVDLLGIAICSGIYVVPLYAIMQHDSDPDSRARTIATNNVMNAIFMVVAAAATVAMLKASFGVPQVFLTMGAINALVAVYIRKVRTA